MIQNRPDRENTVRAVFFAQKIMRPAAPDFSRFPLKTARFLGFREDKILSSM